MKKAVFFTVCCMLLVLPSIQAFSQELLKATIWKGFDDKSEKGDSVCNFTFKKETIEGKAYLVAAMKGTVTKKYQYGFIGIEYVLEPADQAKIAKAGKVKFKVLGDGKTYKFRLETSDVKDFDYHTGGVFTTKGKVVEVEIPYASLKQEGWGQPVAFDKTKVMKLSFQTSGQPHESIELKVFDIRFE